MASIGSLGQVFSALAQSSKMDRSLIEQTCLQISAYIQLANLMQKSPIYTKLVKPDFFSKIVRQALTQTERLELVRKAMEEYAQEPTVVNFSETLLLRSEVMKENYGACRGKVQYTYLAYRALCSQLQHSTEQLTDLVVAGKNINSNPDIIFDPITVLRMVEDLDRTNETIADTEDRLVVVCQDLTSRVGRTHIGRCHV